MAFEGNQGMDLASEALQGAAGGAALGPYGALIGAGVGLAKSAYGIHQANKAKKLAAENIRPTYKIPDEIHQNLSDAQRMALEGLPDEQKQQFVNNVQRSQQFGLQTMSSRKAGLAGLGALTQNSNDAYNQLMSQDAQARQRNQQALMQQRGILAGYKDRVFDINQMQPYQDKAAAARALQGAGLQNVYGGLNDVSQAALRMPAFKKNKGLDGNPQSDIIAQQAMNPSYDTASDDPNFVFGGGGLNG